MPSGAQHPTAGTGDWILEDDDYKRWVDKGGILWLCGRMGTGKSTIMQHIVERERQQSSNAGTFVLSFFFHRGYQLQGSSQGMFQKLLHQLLSSNEDYLDQFYRDSEFAEKCKGSGLPGERWNWDEVKLMTACEKYVRLLASDKQVRVFIDALDECDDKAVRVIVDFFQELAKSMSSRICICLASRPVRDGGKVPLLDGQYSVAIDLQRKNSCDIQIYLEKTFAPLEGHKPEKELDRVKGRLLERSSGVFRWIALVTERAVSLMVSESVEYTLAKVGSPEELDRLYADALRKVVPGNEVEVAFRIFERLVCSTAPIAVEDIRYLICISTINPPATIRDIEECEYWARDDQHLIKRASRLSGGMVQAVNIISHSKTQRAMRTAFKPFLLDPKNNEKRLNLDDDLCLSLLKHQQESLRYDTYLQFDHESVHEFMSSKGLTLLASRAPRLSVITSRVRLHLEISHRFLCFLQTNDRKRFVVGSRVRYDQKEGDFQQELDGKHPFAEYAYHNFYCNLYAAEDHHRRASDESGTIEMIEFFTGKQPSSWSYITILNDTFDAPSWTNGTGRSSVLHIVARCGFADVLEKLIDHYKPLPKFSIDVEDALGFTPLCDAAAYGSIDAVKVLLKLGADAQHMAEDCRTPLHLAAANGNFEIVDLLLKSGVDTDERDTAGATPLLDAICIGHDGIIERLLQYHPAVHCDHAPGPPSDMAIFLWYYQKSFVSRRVKRQDCLATPLQIAWKYRSSKLLQLFLESRDIDGDLRTTNGSTLLHILKLTRPMQQAFIYHSMLARQQLENTTTLIECGQFDVNAAGERGYTPLLSAIEAGQTEITKILVSFEATDVNMAQVGGEGITALGLAAWEGDIDVVRLLLASGKVEMNAGLANGTTPLQLAIANNRVEIIATLLRESGVDHGVPYGKSATSTLR